ncbi:ATP synthase F1 subunit gamma [Candidatus Curtissbacteria bacterium RIFCSPHIGHO2_12_FULL_38_9b]|uniref:ATP synthase gamma chain n=2 Tax=Candidatus Curtissiibacteriota TaxID=1752717 RepID=A0A1F5GSX7_9BACT|nr:MAG: ATP synthase F1 subunit gamma [Candidatus Curtissbacteria bacterium RIFCSPHIGHO2_12_FULL_38_9b]OGD95056.1 MAG: ATP synthase F1 subunit gamma [Candidatus Curtissbacteria bacterium RIFCSPLOWO2_01_FULL_37_9]
MAQIREIKKRIKSIHNTQKVTHAMELVAGAKMRKAQQQTLASRPYSMTLNDIIAEVEAKIELSDTLLSPNDSQTQIYILITSDRGLAGGLNINLFREILKSDLKNVHYITVGKKATTFAAKTNGQIIASFDSEEKEPLDLARILTKMAIDAYTSAKVSKVSLIYPHFLSTIKQIPTQIQLLPIELKTSDQLPTTNEQQPADLLFEPTAGDILKEILPHFVLTQIYQVLLEAKASEHSARMVAMKNATDAAGDLIEDLTLTYNQARQESITTELLDIITAQKALE